MRSSERILSHSIILGGNINEIILQLF